MLTKIIKKQMEKTWQIDEKQMEKTWQIDEKQMEKGFVSYVHFKTPLFLITQSNKKYKLLTMMLPIRIFIFFWGDFFQFYILRFTQRSWYWCHSSTWRPNQDPPCNLSNITCTMVSRGWSEIPSIELLLHRETPVTRKVVHPIIANIPAHVVVSYIDMQPPSHIHYLMHYPIPHGETCNVNRHAFKRVLFGC